MKQGLMPFISALGIRRKRLSILVAAFFKTFVIGWLELIIICGVIFICICFSK